MPSLPRPLPGTLIGSLALFGCQSPQEYRQEADDAVYAILLERRAEIAAHPESFTIDLPENTLRQQLLQGEVLAAPLTLVQLLEIASENSREYQSARESLYLSALDLTLERFDYAIQVNGDIGAFLAGIGSVSSAGGDADFGLTKVLGTGAVIVGNIGLSALRVLSGGQGWAETSVLSLSVVQPLMRGFGKDIVLEPLTQAERNVVYAVRTYERFRRSFGLDVASRMFRVLEQREALEISQRNAESLKILARRNEALAEAGQLSDIEADQARQNKLSAENGVIAAQASYERLLDDLKLFMGLPIDAWIEIDPAEYESLKEVGLQDYELDEEIIVPYALANRLDYLNTLDRIQDSQRKLVIAADNLRAGLDLSADVALANIAAEGPFDFDFSDVVWRVGLDLDLPLQRLPERNAYRSALISLDVAARNAEAQHDSIQVDLRDALRNIAALREAYEIQLISEELALRRVESSALSLEAGRAQTRDVLDAQTDLLGAENAVLNSLVDYRLSVLALLLNAEALRVDETGLSAAPFASQDEEGAQFPAPEDPQAARSEP